MAGEKRKRKVLTRLNHFLREVEVTAKVPPYGGTFHSQGRKLAAARSRYNAQSPTLHLLSNTPNKYEYV